MCDLYSLAPVAEWDPYNLHDVGRHATVEVHHFFFQVPHLRSSKPHPKTD